MEELTVEEKAKLKAVAIQGSKQLKVSNPAGGDKKISVTVRQIKASECYAVMALIDNEFSFTQFVTGLETELLDAIANAFPDEFDALTKLAYDINLDFFSSYLARKKSLNKRMKE